MSQNPSQEALEDKAVELEALAPVVEAPGTTSLESASTQTKPAKKEENLLAALGFALGFSALFFLNTYAIPAIFGLILSAVGLLQVKRKEEEGRGFAIWGIALSLLSIVWLGLQYLGVITTSGMLFNFIKAALGFRT